MDTLFAASNYLKYRFRASNAHDIHSPFVFDLLNNVILDKSNFYGFELIESLRAKLLLDHHKIKVTDFGTGKNFREESVSAIARKSVKPKKYGQLLFRLANTFKPETIIELGTSLGISTLYLSLPNKDTRIITLEGCPETAAIAQQNFNKLRRTNIEIIPGEFDDSLPKALDKLSSVDMIYFDGNHRRDATISYFNRSLKYVHENSILIFDDIHWSREMEMAWEEIKKNESVSLSIDLYQLGIVFLRKGVAKQDFVLAF